MKISIFLTLLAVCLLAFASNVNSKSIELESSEVDKVVGHSKSAEDNSGKLENSGAVDNDEEGSEDVNNANDSNESQFGQGSSAFTDITEATETTEPETTDVPETTTINPTDSQTDIKEVRRTIKDFMFMVEKIALSAIDSIDASITNEEKQSYVTDLIKLIKQTMIGLLDDFSIAANQNAQDIQKMNIDIVEFLSSMEQRALAAIDFIDVAVKEEEIHNEVIRFVEIIEQKMLSIVDGISEHQMIETDPQPIYPQVPLFPGNDIIPNEEIEAELIHSRTLRSFKSILKSILKTLRGVNCSIKAVVNVKEASEQMLANYYKCGTAATKNIQAVVKSAQEVLNISNEIIHINSELCDNPDFLADVDASKTSSKSCAKKLRKKINSLNKKISSTVKLTKKVPLDAGECAISSFSKYREEIVGFPDAVNSCANL